jgi:hypothetical protein
MQKLTKEQAVIISAYTGVLICELDDYLSAINERIGAALTPESVLIRPDMQAKIRKAFNKDFLALAPDSTSN